MREPIKDSIVVTVTTREKRQLAELAVLAGLTVEQFAHERLLAGLSVEEQVLRFLCGELSAVARSERVSEPAERTSEVQPCPESPEEQKARILEEVRTSLTDDQLDALAATFKPAFDTGLWPTGAPAPDDV